MGKGGFGLIVLLIAALITALLFSTQMGSMQQGPSKEEQKATVEKTEEQVNAVNDALDERMKQYENLG